LEAIGDPGAAWGTYHFVNAGETSWHGLAEHLFDWQAKHGAAQPEVHAITTADYPTPAHRPANSRLDTSLITAKFGISPRPWQEAVDEILAELAMTEEEQRTT
jgi:dTDP-4-dehydrorhamnose reductase